MISFFKKELKEIDPSYSKEYKEILQAYLSVRKQTPFWPYCTNQNFIEIIEKTLCKEIKDKKPVTDQIEKITTMAREDWSIEEYESFTSAKNRQKSAQNEVGLFQQYILGSCKGWQSSNKGVDLYNENKNIYLELKNRWNTLNAASRESTCKKLQKLADKGYTCYLAYVIPKKESYDRYIEKYNINEICGDKLFELITGNKNSKDELEFAVNEYFEYKKLKMKNI